MYNTSRFETTNPVAAKRGSPVRTGVDLRPAGVMKLELKHLLELAISVDDLANPQALFGSADKYLRQIRAGLNVRISARDSVIRLSGDTKSVTAAAVVIERLQARAP